MDPDQQQNIHVIVICGDFDYYKYSLNERYLFSVGGTRASLFNVSKSYAHLERGIEGQICQTGNAASLAQLLLQRWHGWRGNVFCKGVWLWLQRAAVCTREISRRDSPLMCTWHLLYLCQAPRWRSERCPLALPGLAFQAGGVSPSGD